VEHEILFARGGLLQFKVTLSVVNKHVRDKRLILSVLSKVVSDFDAASFVAVEVNKLS
jgi:hypothetical protein